VAGTLVALHSAASVEPSPERFQWSLGVDYAKSASKTEASENVLDRAMRCRHHDNMAPRALTRNRECFRLSQAQVARLSGVAKHRISLYESGDISLTSAERVRIVRALEQERQRLASIPPIEFREAS